MVENTPDGSEGGHRWFAALMTGVLLASVGLAAGAGTVTANHDNGVGANYTVNLPSEQDHYPGEQGGKASIQHFATGEGAFEKQGAKGLETLGYIVVSSPAIDFSSCTTTDTTAFGIDRGGDDSGTHTDDNLLDHRESSSFNDHSIVVNFYDEGDTFGSTTYVNQSDQIVAVQNSCYVMPKKPGWYQINARLNGTTYSGEQLDEPNIKSHYFYVCECANEQEAREQLGPPPSEGGDGEQSTSTPTATDTGGSTPTDDGTVTSTATDTGDGSPTPTGTSHPSATASATTATETTPTTSPPADGQQTTSDGSTTATGGSNRKVTASSPTVSSGPGFGPAVAVLALVSAAVLALRER